MSCRFHNHKLTLPTTLPSLNFWVSICFSLSTSLALFLSLSLWFFLPPLSFSLSLASFLQPGNTRRFHCRDKVTVVLHRMTRIHQKLKLFQQLSKKYNHCRNIYILKYISINTIQIQSPSCFFLKKIPIKFGLFSERFLETSDCR